jgi:hypothetical protein
VDIPPSETKTGNSIDESVAATGTEQKVERPGQAEVLACTDVALKKLEKVDADSKENHNKVNAETKKRKSQIVQEYAQDLEGIGFPTDRIAAEITQQLRKKVSKSLILDCLDEKYKTSYRVENARKGKERKEMKNPEGLAPVVPKLELKPKIVVDRLGHQMVEPAAETRQPDLDDNNVGTTNTESKEESSITPSLNDATQFPTKQTTRGLTDTKKEVFVSHIPMPFEALRKDMAIVFQTTKGIGNIFFKVSVDLGKHVAEIEFCGITEQKDVIMISSGEGELKEA